MAEVSSADAAKKVPAEAVSHARTSSGANFERRSKQLEAPTIVAANPKFLVPLYRALKGSRTGATTDAAIVKDYLHQQANWAAALLRDLAQGDHAGSYDKLKPSVLNSCGALAFINASKGGLALSLASGYGFLIRKTSQDQYGNSTWGMPLFFTVSQAGIGITAGYQHSQSVIAVLAQGALDVFKNGTKSLGSDLGLFSTDGALTGMSGGAALGDSQHMGMTVDNERSAFCYSKVDGVYLELSAHTSSVAPDRESNTALYGEQYDVEQVLNNETSYKQEMLPLYSTIAHLGKVAVRGEEHLAA